MKQIPMLKKRILTERISVPLDVETKQQLMKLKHDKGVNVPEWIRQMIHEKLEKMEKVV